MKNRSFLKIPVILFAVLSVLPAASAAELGKIFFKDGRYELEIKNYKYSIIEAPQQLPIQEIINQYEKAKYDYFLDIFMAQKEQLASDVRVKIEDTKKELDIWNAKMQTAEEKKQSSQKQLELKQQQFSSTLLGAQKQITALIKEKKEVTESISRLLTTEEEEKKSSARNLEEQKTELVANSKVLDEKIANITQEISALKAKKKEKYSVNEKKLQAKRQEIEKFKSTVSKVEREFFKSKALFEEEKYTALESKFLEENQQNVYVQWDIEPTYGANFRLANMSIVNNTKWDIRNISIGIFYKSSKGLIPVCEVGIIRAFAPFCSEYFHKGSLTIKDTVKGLNKYNERFTCIRTNTEAPLKLNGIFDRIDLEPPADLRAFERLSGTLDFDARRVVMSLKSIEFGQPTIDGEKECAQIDFRKHFKMDVENLFTNLAWLPEKINKINQAKSDLNEGQNGLRKLSRAIGKENVTFAAKIDLEISEKTKNLNFLTKDRSSAETKLSQLKSGGMASAKTISNMKQKNAELKQITEKILGLRKEVENSKSEISSIKKDLSKIDEKLSSYQKEVTEKGNVLAKDEMNLEQIKNTNEELNAETIKVVESRANQNKLRELKTQAEIKFFKFISSLQFNSTNQIDKISEATEMEKNVIIYKKLIKFGDVYFLTNLNDLHQGKRLEFSSLAPKLEEIRSLKN